MQEESDTDLTGYQNAALAALDDVRDEKALEAWYRKYLAPSGSMNQWRPFLITSRKPYRSRFGSTSARLRRSPCFAVLSMRFPFLFVISLL